MVVRNYWNVLFLCLANSYQDITVSLLSLLHRWLCLGLLKVDLLLW